MKWISVKDELPTSENSIVLVTTDNGYSGIEVACHYDGRFVSDKRCNHILDVTHWCALPPVVKDNE